MKIQIETLEQLFAQFNHDLFANELIAPMITIQSKGKKNALGWCSTVPFWGEEDTKEVTMYYEINICAEYLNRGLLDVSETLLHEMVHLSNAQKGIKDCSKSGSHNKKFKEGCELINLYCNKNSKPGWSDTSLSPTLIEYINSLKIENVFNISRVIVDKKASKPPTPKIKYVCPECGATLSSKIEGLEIECKKCSVLFNEM